MTIISAKNELIKHISKWYIAIYDQPPPTYWTNLSADELRLQANTLYYTYINLSQLPRFMTNPLPNDDLSILDSDTITENYQTTEIDYDDTIDPDDPDFLDEDEDDEFVFDSYIDNLKLNLITTSLSFLIYSISFWISITAISSLITNFK